MSVLYYGRRLLMMDCKQVEIIAHKARITFLYSSLITMNEKKCFEVQARMLFPSNFALQHEEEASRGRIPSYCVELR
jgi:hypothetical protein